MRYDANDVTWEKMSIRCVEGYFCSERIDKSTVPKMFNVWEIALGDYYEDACRYKQSILVNFFGTFITKEQLPIDNKESGTGYFYSDDWHFCAGDPVKLSKLIKEEEMDNIFAWYHIPGFNGYQISESGIVRSMKNMHKDPGHVLKKDKSGKYILTNSENERVRISPEELIKITFHSGHALNAVMPNTVYLGGRNKVFTKGNVNNDPPKETFKLDLYSKVMSKDK